MADDAKTGLADLLAAAEPIDGGLALTIPESWLQGRTAYGGLTSAIALAVAQGALPDLPPLRSGQMAMVAPLAGRIEARARVLRQGRNATWVAVELSNESGVGFAANFVFMRRIESRLDIAGYPLPEGVIPVDAAPAVPMDVAPAFLRNHFEARFGLSPTDDADLCWWVRAREREGLDPEVACLLCGDVLPTAVWPLLSYSVPISSMHWHVNMLDAAPSEDGWWLIRSTSELARDGAASEHITQWSETGAPAIAGMQSVAVFG